MDIVSRRHNQSITSLVLIVVVFVALAAYGMMAISIGDALWFLTDFNVQPAAITLYCRGEEVAVTPASDHYENITDLMNTSLSGYKFWDQLSMSDNTYSYYQTNDDAIALQVEYDDAVRIPSIYKFFSTIDTLVIPLEGRHADSMPVFGSNDGNITAGSLHLETTEPLHTYISNNGLCRTNSGGA